nr:MAG TPA: hypothetical protein [Caudoviricetes sp.]
MLILSVFAIDIRSSFQNSVYRSSVISPNAKSQLRLKKEILGINYSYYLTVGSRSRIH